LVLSFEVLSFSFISSTNYSAPSKTLHPNPHARGMNKTKALPMHKNAKKEKKSHKNSNIVESDLKKMINFLNNYSDQKGKFNFPIFMAIQGFKRTSTFDSRSKANENSLSWHTNKHIYSNSTWSNFLKISTTY
jgi:formyltetrahydrofolate synthetase